MSFSEHFKKILLQKDASIDAELMAKSIKVTLAELKWIFDHKIVNSVLKFGAKHSDILFRFAIGNKIKSKVVSFTGEELADKIVDTVKDMYITGFLEKMVQDEAV